MENDIFGGFTAFAQSISYLTPYLIDTGGEEENGLPGPDDLKTGINEHSGIEDLASEEGGDHIELKDLDEEDEENDDKVDEEASNDEDGDKEDPDLGSDFGEAEPELAAYLQEQLFKEFGFEDSDKEFGSIEEVVNFVKEVVDENSKPTFANAELADLNEFVLKGGDINTYLETAHSGLDTSNVDIESPSSQKRVLSETLKLKGYSPTKIERALERYEDAGVLQEEAEDALEILEEYKEEKAKKLLEDQKEYHESMIEQQQKYVDSVKQEIEDLSDVRGIPLTKKEKKELAEYIFKPTRTGKTKYQEEYVKSQRNMIESAFFTMKGDALVKKVQKKATSEAASRLRKKLANKGTRGRNQSAQGGNTVSNIWDIASKELRSPF